MLRMQVFSSGIGDDIDDDDGVSLRSQLLKKGFTTSVVLHKHIPDNVQWCISSTSYIWQLLGRQAYTIGKDAEDLVRPWTLTGLLAL
jgi:hypothetical protein